MIVSEQLSMERASLVRTQTAIDQTKLASVYHASTVITLLMKKICPRILFTKGSYAIMMNLQ